MNVTNLFDLAGRTAAITGASSGIGLTMSKALAAAGAHVVMIARRAAELQRARDEIREIGDTADFLRADLATPNQALAVGKQLMERFGHINILVNAAGINLREPANKVTVNSWQQTINLNLSVPFFLARTLIPVMRVSNYGKIINIASLQSTRAFPNSIAYGASKGGVCQLTRAMAEEWSRDGISCNAIAPGFFPTALTAAVFDDEARSAAMAAQTAIGRNGKLEDLHGIAIFLASRSSDYITGQTIYVDGGFTAK